MRNALSQVPASLTDAELLAVIIRTGSREETSLELARQHTCLWKGMENRLLGLLHHSLEDYCRIKGVGKVKGAQLMCIGELSRRIWNCKARETPVFLSLIRSRLQTIIWKICAI